MAFTSSQRLIANKKLARRTAAPSLSKPRCVVARAVSDNRLIKKPEFKRPEESRKLFDQTDTAAPAAAAVAVAGSTLSAPETSNAGASIEYQRSRAKEMRKYFQDLRMQQAVQKAQVFGWTKKNEISNSRWVMFGFAVGLLTEYATGVDFIDQLKLLVSYLGIADLE